MRLKPLRQRSWTFSWLLGHWVLFRLLSGTTAVQIRFKIMLLGEWKQT